MRLYLDDDSVDAVLVRLLRQAGHDTQRPADAGLSGAHDAVQLRHAIHEGRTFFSHNSSDFEYLHQLVREAHGRHHGILIVRKDNDPRRDMTPRGIVNAIGRLLAANAPIDNELNVLNQWR
jgi:hypothetical protein